ncbi:hypothetical protein F4167_14445 [Candidatus Poribacteria bacterium]|nr:hypothetical protein [Candidatus Poribacteria bacterium]
MRFIAVIVFLIVVAIAISWFAFDRLDSFGQDSVMRWSIFALIVLLTILAAFAAAVIRYRIPKADVALVRTGGSKEKINITKGLWVNTIIHEIKEISLNTMRIEVIREGTEALITYDFNRGDVEVVFYLKVEPIEDDVLRAAQALGDKSMTPETVRELIEPKLEGALRSVAAESEIQDLLQKRQEFADKVQEACGEDLEIQNGLTLETVSIIRVDQTPVDTLDAENRFDAVGIREITEITADQYREKVDIEQRKEVAVVQIEVSARIEKFAAEQEQAWAESDQQKNIAIYAAEREAETIKFQFEMEQSVQEREYEMKQEVERARITQEQVVQEREIEMNRDVEVARVQQEQIVAEREIEKNLIVETQQIEQSKVVQLAEIEQFLTVQLQKIEQEQAIEVREIEKVLTVEKTRIAQEEGVMLRDIERELIVQTERFAQEQQVMQREIEKNLVVETAQIDQMRHVELAEIAKMLNVEQSRIGQELRVALTDEDRKIEVANKQQVTALAEKEKLVAEAERMGAEVNVTATEEVMSAEWQREVAVIGAEAQAQPIERLADAVLAEARAKAQGEMAEYEARNVAEQRVLVQEAILELINDADDIIEQMMRPVEKIDSIKILDMGNNDGQGGINRSSMGRLANALLDTGAISPMLKELFNFADVDAQQITDKIAEYLADLVNRPS